MTEDEAAYLADATKLQSKSLIWFEKEEYDNMIECDNSAFTFGWFHFCCVGIVTPPAGQWFCDDCQNTM